MAHKTGQTARQIAGLLIPVNLPIRLQCVRVPVKWEYETVRGEDGSDVLWLGATGNREDRVSVFDPWEKRAEFLRLKEDDPEALLQFLDSIGLFYPADIRSALEMAHAHAEDNEWGSFAAMRENYRVVDAEDGPHTVWGGFIPLTIESIWNTQRATKLQMKAPRKGFGFDAWDFSLRLADLRSGPAAVLTTFSFQDALAAAVRIDHLQQAKFHKCKRPDCGVEFMAVGPRKRKYCCWYCGHLESIRRSRKQEKQRARRQ